MEGHAPFHVQLDEHLRRRLWTHSDLLNATQAPNGRGADASGSLFSRNIAAGLDAILAGQLAPTEAFGALVANLIIGRPDGLDADGLRAREELIGAAYVAECHGRRQQPPYIHGVIGESSPSNSAESVDQSESRQEKVNEQQRQRLLNRLIELEEKQEKKRTREATNGPRRSNKVPQNKRRPPGPRTSKPTRIEYTPRLSPEMWDAAATESLKFIPDQARRDDPAQEKSFVDLAVHSFLAGHRFAQFLESLLIAWRSEKPSSRGRLQTRMSPEQLGILIGQRNRSRYASDRQKQAWFRRHKGPGVTGNALRNYLSGHSERPLRECLQKMICAFVPNGDVQIGVEQRLWKMANGQYPLHPPTVDELLEVIEAKLDRPQSRRQVLKRFAVTGRTFRGGNRIAVDIEQHGHPFHALADEAGVLLTPLVNPKTRHVVVDVGTILSTEGTLLTPIDVALSSGRRSSLMRALVHFSGIPITRISELTQVHESLFQQWMREGPSRRIEDRERAGRIVNLLNPPSMARWPITSDRIEQQNEQAINFLTTNTSSLDEALSTAQECPISAAYQLDEDGRKTYRAAYLLRQVFGRDSLSNLTGPHVGRLLAGQGLGDEQAFKHLREGIRDGGRKSARRASLEQAHFFADLLEQTLGGLDGQTRRRFIECVACVELDSRGNLLTPVQLLRQVEDATSTLTLPGMTKEIMRRRGGLVRFSREVGISQQSIRSFVSRKSHYLHHPVARRLAERGMGFAPGSEEHRQFVILGTAAWKKRGKRVQARLSGTVVDYLQRLRLASAMSQVRDIRAETMGALLSQPALSPKQLAKKLRVTQAVLAGWTTPRIGHFTSQKALDRFARLMDYEAEQVSFIQETFGPLAKAGGPLAKAGRVPS